jgi:hypothetical protein
MEVASMLASEPFTDEPRCVCPVIAEFLRTYNDNVDDARRQDLFAYASLVVDTRKGPRAERARANQCLDWWLRESSPKHRRLRRFLWMLAPSSAARDIEIAHRAAHWAAAAPERHQATLELVALLSGSEPLQLPLTIARHASDADHEPEWTRRSAEARRHPRARAVAHAHAGHGDAG